MHQWTRIVILLMQITLVNEQIKKIRFQHELKYSRHLIFDFDTIFLMDHNTNSVQVNI